MSASEERTYLIALTQLYRNRLRHLRQLLEHYGSAQQAWQAITDEGKSQAWEKAQAEESFIRRHNIDVFCFGDETYPMRLRNCPDAPILLYGKGNIHANKGKMVSVVGTRGCSERGKEMTRRLVLDLAAKVPDVTIISGLAYGIDIAAHRAALEAGIPTLAIAGHGLDRIYPQYHRKEAVAALEKGGLLTEYPSGTDPERHNFIARDRIIAGMADVVVVVESKLRGGSLITARMASDYARELFAFPGRPQDELSQGCNQLIRDQKAGLIESADDLIAAMMWKPEDKPANTQTELVELNMPLNEQEKQLLQQLRSEEDGIHINFLVMETGVPYSTIAATLTMMEMKGLVKSLPGGIYRAIR